MARQLRKIQYMVLHLWAVIFNRPPRERDDAFHPVVLRQLFHQRTPHQTRRSDDDDRLFHCSLQS